VTDNEGATTTDWTTCVITQPNRPPTTPIISGTTEGLNNTIYQFWAKSTDPDGDMIQYMFDWGDPLSQPQVSRFLPNWSGFNLTHSWAAAGRYEITVTVTDNQTMSSSKKTIYIDAEPLDDIGYLLNNIGDSSYDGFYSNVSKQITIVQMEKGNYNIDSDGDGNWEYTFSTAKGLILYQKPPLELIFVFGTLILIATWIVLVLLWMRKTKKHT